MLIAPQMKTTTQNAPSPVGNAWNARTSEMYFLDEGVQGGGGDDRYIVVY